MTTQTEEKTQTLTVQSVQIAPNGVVQLRSIEDTFRLARAIYQSGLAPTSLKNEQAVLVALLMGCELGLGPMQAIQSIAVINGRPSIYGDTALALVRQSGLLESYSQTLTGEGDNRKALVVLKRKGDEATEFSFSVSDAKRAQLWAKAGPWSQYPDRMLMFRARGFALRDVFGDILRGFRTSEEVADIPEDDHESRFAHATPVNVAAPPFDSPRRRGRPPLNKQDQYPDNGIMSPLRGSEPEKPAEPEPPSLLEQVRRELSADGETEQRFLAVLAKNKLNQSGAKELEKVSEADLQIALDNWEGVRKEFSKLQSQDKDIAPSDEPRTR
jgi:hypothetical protein